MQQGGVDKGVFGGCKEYLSFDFFPDGEVIVTTRSYKSITTMLGEFGGILKIITTAVFFVYGVYSMRKVKSVLGGIIFGEGQGSEKQLRELVDGKKEPSKRVTRVEKIAEKGVMKVTSEEDEFQKLVERFVSRRSNVDNLMKKLNLLELIERVVFKEHEKTLVPLVLLKAEQSDLQKNQQEDVKKISTEEVEITQNQEKSKIFAKKSTNAIINKQDLPESNKEDKFSYQRPLILSSTVTQTPPSG